MSLHKDSYFTGSVSNFNDFLKKSLTTSSNSVIIGACAFPLALYGNNLKLISCVCVRRKESIALSSFTLNVLQNVA